MEKTEFLSKPNALMNIPSSLIRCRDLVANHSHPAAVRDNTRFFRGKADNVGPFLQLYIDPAG